MILKYMMKSINMQNPPKPCEVFDLICGTSTGGLMAIMLGRLRMSVQEAIDAYLDLSKRVFAPKHRHNLVAGLLNVANTRGKCDSAALEAAIKEVIEKSLGVGHKDDKLLDAGSSPDSCHV